MAVTDEWELDEEGMRECKVRLGLVSLDMGTAGGVNGGEGVSIPWPSGLGLFPGDTDTEMLVLPLVAWGEYTLTGVLVLDPAPDPDAEREERFAMTGRLSLVRN